MARDSFVFHIDFIDEELLTAEEIGLLTIAIIHYSQDQTVPTFEDRALTLIWRNIQKWLDADNEAYKEKCRKNKENINKRWNKDTTEYDGIRPNTNGYEAIPSDTKNTDIDIDIDTHIDLKEKGTPLGVPKEKSTKRFSPPTLEEVKSYCAERNNRVDAEHFIDFYQRQDWYLSNGRKMKDWRAAVRNWEYRDKTKPKVNKFNTFEQRQQTNFDEIEARMFNRRVGT